MGAPGMGLRRGLAWLVAGVVAGTAAADVQPVLEDAVAIEIVDRELLAFVQQGGPYRERLQKDEQVLFQSARGLVGAVATNRRLLAAAPASAGWVEAPLQLSEKALPTRLVRGRVALFTTERRILVFDSNTRLWLSATLNRAEPVIEAAAGQGLAVVVTPYRALAFAPGLSGFREFALRLGEDVQSLNALADLATLRTSQRLLLFRGEIGAWRAESLPLQ